MSLTRRRQHRPRRYVAPTLLAALSRGGLFRYDEMRHAYVLRLVGRRVGPALKPRRPAH